MSATQQGVSYPVGKGKLRVANASTAVGYLNASKGQIIDQMAQNRLWLWAMTPDTQIFVHRAYPIHLMAGTAASIIASARAVVLGVALKSQTQGPIVAIASVVQNLSLALTYRAFGVRIVLYDAPLTYRPGYYHIALSDGAYSATEGANAGEFYVSSPHNRVEVMAFFIQNGVGQASIIAAATPTVTVVASDSATVAATATTTTVGVFAETLNIRDLGV